MPGRGRRNAAAAPLLVREFSRTTFLEGGGRSSVCDRAPRTFRDSLQRGSRQWKPHEEAFSRLPAVLRRQRGQPSRCRKRRQWPATGRRRRRFQTCRRLPCRRRSGGSKSAGIFLSTTGRFTTTRVRRAPSLVSARTIWLSTKHG